jgi:hypothetical protein
MGIFEEATASAPNFISPLLTPTLQPSPHSPPAFTQLAPTVPTLQRRPQSPPIYTQLARPPRAPKDDFSRHRQPSFVLPYDTVESRHCQVHNYTNSFPVNPEPQDSPPIQYSTAVNDSGRYSQNSTATVFSHLTSSLSPEVGETLLPELPPVVIFDESSRHHQPDMYRRFDSSPPPYGMEDETRQKRRRRKKKKKREQQKEK